MNNRCKHGADGGGCLIAGCFNHMTPEQEALDRKIAEACAEVKQPRLRPPAPRGLSAERDQLRARVAELEALIDTPHTGDFFEAVRLEAAHQVKRWGVEHDDGKKPADWFWLVGYLLGKALHFPEKRKHHLVSSAAALLNWYRAETGDSTAMRPGIETPEGER